MSTASTTYPTGPGGGWTCSMCRAFIPFGNYHQCPTQYMPPQPLYQPPVTITYVPLTEERIREIVREELDKTRRERP